MQMNSIPKGQAKTTAATGEYKVIKPFALSLDTAISYNKKPFLNVILT